MSLPASLMAFWLSLASSFASRPRACFFADACAGACERSSAGQREEEAKEHRAGRRSTERGRASKRRRGERERRGSHRQEGEEERAWS
eukprot:2252542-Rhodomonas_salina.1